MHFLLVLVASLASYIHTARDAPIPVVYLSFISLTTDLISLNKQTRGLIQRLQFFFLTNPVAMMFYITDIWTASNCRETVFILFLCDVLSFDINSALYFFLKNAICHQLNKISCPSLCCQLPTRRLEVFGECFWLHWLVHQGTRDARHPVVSEAFLNNEKLTGSTCHRISAGKQCQPNEWDNRLK